MSTEAWAVTVNLGGASPCARPTQRSRAMIDWAESALVERAPLIIFAQEVPNDAWLDVWADAGYQVFDNGKDYRARSAILTAAGIVATKLTEAELPTLKYHKSYVAAASWHRQRGDAVTLLSVHASPDVVSARYFDDWSGACPKPRNGGPEVRYAGRLWDADMVLETIIRASGSGPTIAAGDLNEARAWDIHHPPETWGKEYFDRAKSAMLHDHLNQIWKEERPTHVTQSAEVAMQLDHVFASQNAKTALDSSVEPELDPRWNEGGRASSDLSDHIPVWFAISP